MILTRVKAESFLTPAISEQMGYGNSFGVHNLDLADLCSTSQKVIYVNENALKEKTNITATDETFVSI